MEHNTITEKQYIHLVDEITPLILSRGPCDTSMDFIAQHFSMSKRTLYEIFESKDDMLRAVMTRMRSRMSEGISEILRNSSNIMESMVNIFLFHQRMTQKVTAKFFCDMDGKYNYLRTEHEQGFERWKNTMLAAFNLGVEQGVFRSDSNFEIIIRLLRIQIESLKRMEEFFPPDITLQEASNTVCLSLLRSIASKKGMDILDQYSYKFTTSEN